MAYQNTLQADALKLVAKKLQSSLAVEGELPEDGLAAYGDDLMLALARKVIAGEGDADSVESVFAQAQQVAAEAEALLVDAGWRGPGAGRRRTGHGWRASRSAAVGLLLGHVLGGEAGGARKASTEAARIAPSGRGLA